MHAHFIPGGEETLPVLISEFLVAVVVRAVIGIIIFRTVADFVVGVCLSSLPSSSLFSRASCSPVSCLLWLSSSWPCVFLARLLKC
ncbi:MAG: hypothetical protein HZB38_17625 [Planctomycetes bacterium]|nr:hypothetical protein [Planctomycetota bacterium]